MVRVRRWVAAAVLGGTVAPITACNPGSAEVTAGTSRPATAAAPVDIGGSLYPAAKAPPVESVALVADPIIVPNAVVQNNDKLSLSAAVDAKIELLAVPIGPNEPCEPQKLVTHPRDDRPQPQRYRRLVVGDTVKANQLLCRLDEQQNGLQIESARATIAQLKLAIEAAKDAEDKQQKVADATRNLPGVSQSEKLNADSLVSRYKENRFQSMKELAKTEGELLAAENQAQKFWITSPVNGYVVRLLKSREEFVKAGDPIVEIQATDRVRIEGKLDAGYAESVRPGMRVLVEPVRPVSPNGAGVPHRQEVTGICVTGHPGRPLVVSAGMDNAALVWDLTAPKPTSVRLPHPTGVRSVAATGRAVKAQVVATGGDDGVVRLWDVSNPDKLGTRELAKFEESHGAAVSGCAFSPDGRFLATAAGRDVWVWDVAARKRLYALPGDHRDAVTSLRFTPQATLVTAARDKAVRVWKLGDKAAALGTLLDHRGGAVDVLGVSADGGKVLFDKDAGRLDLVSLGDERSVGSLQTSGSGRFAGLALFSPDDALVLTAGGEADQRGELTVWEAPQPGGRAAERRRLITRGGVTATCAAFSPDPDKPFVVVGDTAGGVSYWAAPGRSNIGKQMVATVVSCLPADARSYTLQVEMANPTDQFEGGLKDRSLATIVITPGSEPAAPPAPPAAPPAPAIRPAGGAVPDGNVVPAGGPAPGTARAPSATPPRPLPPASTPAGVSIPPVPAPGGKK